MRPEVTAAPLSIRLFGRFEVLLNGRPLPRLRFRKSQAVLALLALRAGAAVEREGLATLLWPEAAASPALHSLRNCLTDLRAALGPEAGRLRSPTPRTLALDLTGAFVDVLAFDAAHASGDPEALAEAVALYRGPLLEGSAEEWVFQERQAREQGYLTALERLAARARADGDRAGAERWLRLAVAADPLRESGPRALMELLAAGGNYAAALHLYRELRHRLHRELNAAPDPETQALFQRLRQEARGSARGGAGEGASTSTTPPGHPATPSPRHPVTPSPPPPRHNLPLSLTSFIGRQDEIAQVQQLLTVQRLVTLTGIGGCGKTRLALEVGRGLAAAYPEGVWLVELQALTDPSLVPESVAAALGVPEQPEQPLTQSLAAALQPRSLLLLLDNCEHLVDACAALAEQLLQTCPHLRLLATSREPLDCLGEQAYRVPSLSVPPAAEGVQAFGHPSDPPDRSHPSAPNTEHRTPERLTQYEAIQLFAERAAAAQPAFSLTAANAAMVAQICVRLEGIPLAIELAAARLKAVPLATLHARLDNLFAMLTGGRRTALPRHQALRATLDWSYDLLPPAEQVLLQRLSVFAGGGTLAAVEAVCADFGGGEEVLNLLTRLVEKSLVVYEERGGEGRYRLLVMIREYAREKRAGSGEEERLRGQHARFFLGLAEQAERELAQADSGPWLARLEREHDNLRAALAWSGESGKLKVGLRLASALQEFWISRGYAQEGRAHLVRLLARPEAGAPGSLLPDGAAARARALSTAGVLTFFGGELEAARALYEDSLALWRGLEDRAGMATVLTHLGRLAAAQWDWTAARTRAEESLALWRGLGDSAGLANALTLRAEVCRQEGDSAAARALLAESLSIWRALGDRSRLLTGLDTLARAAMEQGDFGAARPAIEESLAVARELGHKPGIAGALTALGHVAHWQEEYLTARAFFQESLLLWRELEHKHGVVDTTGHLALTFIARGESAAAYDLFESVLPLARSLAPLYYARWLASVGGCAADLGRWGEATTRCLESLRMGSSSEYEDPIHIAWDLTLLSGAALVRGEAARAARLLGAAELLWAGSTHRNHPLVHARLAQAEEAVRAQLAPTEYEAAWAEGQATPLEQTIAELLAEAG